MPNAAPWTHNADVHLCRAYTNVSEDGATSTDQSSSLFWDRVSTVFALTVLRVMQERCKAVGRLEFALTSHYMLHALHRYMYMDFIACILNAKIEAHRGWTEEDYVHEAKLSFTAKRKQQNCNAFREYEDDMEKELRKKKENLG
ncbi:hypothetical protein PHMEG_00036049 [Phytophthora megakarya]|uniref:Uncharacterized protein n=1 Tax=Phytophthora megakarya TaxID=4795 RepID=A0A225UQ49_9STRA|nr:hypothetical protein PHMEG_00036049 [Phytophthora megakarya]